jgi:hypothetical protein
MAAAPGPSPTSTPPLEPLGKLLGKGLGLVQQSAVKAMYGASTPFKVVLVILVLTAFIASGLTAVFLWWGTPGYALVFGIVAFVFMLVIVVLILGAGGRPEPELPTVAPIAAQWTILSPPYPDDLIKDLGDLLEKILGKAEAALKRKNNRIGEKNVRANVWLPYFPSTRSLAVLDLKMPMPLQKRMHYMSEQDLILSPGEGVAGKAFANGDEVCGDRDFGLSEKQLEIVHPKLRRIYAFPLKDSNGHILGVLVIDVLNFDPGRDALDEMAKEVRATSQSLGNRLSAHRQIKVVLSSALLKT